MSKRMTRYPTDRKVYVGDLGDNARKNDLEYTFGAYGKLRSVWVARNPPGFAFVEFEDARDAADAVRALDGRKLCGRRARVELSTGRISGNGRRGGGDRPRDGGRGTKCYECGGRGHYARECRRPGRNRRSEVFTYQPDADNTLVSKKRKHSESAVDEEPSQSAVTDELADTSELKSEKKKKKKKNKNKEDKAPVDETESPAKKKVKKEKSDPDKAS